MTLTRLLEDFIRQSLAVIFCFRMVISRNYCCAMDLRVVLIGPSPWWLVELRNFVLLRKQPRKRNFASGKTTSLPLLKYSYSTSIRFFLMVKDVIVLQLSAKDKQFSGKVVEIVNADALMVKVGDGSVRKIFLSSIRPPRFVYRFCWQFSFLNLMELFSIDFDNL